LFAGVLPDEPALDDAIRTLRRYSLVETEPGSITVHRLVQQAVHGRMTSAEHYKTAERVLWKLQDLFVRDSHDVQRWPGCRPLIEHVLHATESVRENSFVAPLIADLLNGLGVHLGVTHDLPKAEEHLRRALRIYEKAYGPEHPQVARTLRNLGNVARKQGD